MVLNSSSHAQLRAMLNDDARMQQIVSDYTAFRSAQSSRPTLLDQLEEYGVNNNNFAAYALAKGGKATIDIAGGFYDLGGAVHADPLGLLTGAGKSVANLGPEVFNTAVDLTKTIFDGYSLIADGVISALGGQENYFADFRSTDAFNLTPLFEYSKSEQAGALIANVAGGKLLTEFGGYGVQFGNIKASGMSRYQSGSVKLEFVRPDGTVIGAANSISPGKGFLVQSGDGVALDMFGRNISPRTQGILDRFSNARRVLLEDASGKKSVVQIVDDIGRRDVKVNDLGRLQAATGNEFSLLRGPNGERVLLQGDPTQMMIPEQYVGNGWKWSGHSHPYSVDPSSSDRLLLRAFQQEQSVIKSAADGRQTTFTQFEDWSSWLPGM